MSASHLGCGLPRTTIPGRNSINATFRAVATEEGDRWIFQDVQPGGPADQAGVKPGDVLLSIDDRQIAPPTQPEFRMKAATAIALIHRNGSPRELKLELSTPRPKYSECPYSEPQNVVASVLQDTIGHLKVTMFPGVIGIDFAHEVDRAIQKLQSCERLIIDLRGNPGGGIGGLRLMSYLTPDKTPVGYSLTRKRAERGYPREDLPRFEGIPDANWQLPFIAARFIGRDLSIAVVTEGRGPQPFHGRIAVVVNEHTAGSGEIVAGFVQENRLSAGYRHENSRALAGRERLQTWR